MVTKYHQTKSGKNVGEWVICKAEQNCRNSGNDTHISKEELNEIKEIRTKIGHITLQEVEDYRSFKATVSIPNRLRNVSTKTITDNGTQEWRLPNGNFHRVDGPAIITSDGDQYWYLNGEKHRDDGPAVEDISGVKIWYKNDEVHRLDGPAVIELNGVQSWYQHGKLHRLDGPAVIRPDGVFNSEQWYNNSPEWAQRMVY